MNPVCDLLEPLFENTKREIFGEIIDKHKPPKKKSEPALSTMKKDQLIEECRKLGLDETGKVSELKDRIKQSRLKKDESVDDLFKKYEQSITKNELAGTS